MIKKFDEMDKDCGKSSFRKFSDIKKNDNEDISTNSLPDTDVDMPMNPNLPKKSTKQESPANTDYLKPRGQKVTPDELKKENIDFIGKIAKFPKKTKASKAFNFLENVKISKNSIWYIMVEKCDNELQMVKYNHRRGVDLNRFVNELKSFYSTKYKGSQKITEILKNIEIDGNDKYSWIKNIPPIEIDGKKMITKITEDLIKLLSK